jgi:hypothetical protein
LLAAAEAAVAQRPIVARAARTTNGFFMFPLLLK